MKQLALLSHLAFVGAVYAQGTFELEPFQRLPSGITRTPGLASADYAGMSLIPMGVDHDGDGRDDFFVGVPGANRLGMNDTGEVWVVSALTSSRLAVIPNPHGFSSPTTAVAENDHFGHSLAMLDIDGDGRSELAVGAPGPTGLRVQLFDVNLAGGVTHLFDIQSPSLGVDDAFGFSLAVGNFVGTRLEGEELAIGAPGGQGTTHEGTVHVYDFFPGGAMEFAAIGYEDADTSRGSRAGFRLLAHDFPNSSPGLDEIVIGAPYSFRTYSGHAQTTGAVFVVDLSNGAGPLPRSTTVRRDDHTAGTALTPSTDWVVAFHTHYSMSGNITEESFARVGSAFAITPDQGGTTAADLVFGAPTSRTIAPNTGTVWICSTALSLVNQDPMQLIGRVNGSNPLGQLGGSASVVSVTATQSDTHLAVGQPGRGPGFANLYEIPGGGARIAAAVDRGELDPAPLPAYHLRGLAGAEQLPQGLAEGQSFLEISWTSEPSIGSTGDVNCDLRGDLIVGSPRADSGRIDDGAVTIYGADAGSGQRLGGVPCGNCDRDRGRMITIIDALAAARASVGLYTGGPECDVYPPQTCGDGRISILDAFEIARYTLGLSQGFCCPASCP